MGHAVFHSVCVTNLVVLQVECAYTRSHRRGRLPRLTSRVRSGGGPCSRPASFPPAVLNGVGGSGMVVELCDWNLSVACSSSSAHSGIMRVAFRRGFVIEKGIGGYFSQNSDRRRIVVGYASPPIVHSLCHLALVVCNLSAPDACPRCSGMFSRGLDPQV